MIKNLEILYEKYNFDYIYINPKNIDDINFEFIPEETVVDFSVPPNYLGSVKIKQKLIEIYWDKKVNIDDIIFKYKSIKKERLEKIKNIKKES